MLALRIKKAVRNGATLVVADPRAIWLTKLAKRHLQLRPGSDVWLLNAIMHVILEEGPAGRRLHRRALRGLRVGAGGRRPLHARGGGARHRRAGRGDPQHRPRVRDRAARRDLLHARDHRARVRRRQHLVAREPRPDDRPPRLRVDRAERAPRPEQRPGPERLRREPALLPRLPALGRPRGAGEVRGRLGRRPAGARRLPARPDDVGAPRRPDQGALPDRREPRPDGAEREARRGRAGEARVHGRAGPVPERDVDALRGRRAPRVELRGEGRHVHEHRAPDQPGARGRALPGQRARRPRDRDRSLPARSAATGPSIRTRSRSGTSSPTSRRTGSASAIHGSRSTGSSGPAPRPTTRERSSCTRITRRCRTGRASSIRSSTSRRSRSPTPTTRSCCPRGERCTTTTRAG